MIDLLSYLLPSVISLNYFLEKKPTKITVMETLVIYSKCVIMNILSTYFVLLIFSDLKGATVFHGGVSFVIQYLAIATFFAVLLPRLYDYIASKISIRVSMKKVEKDEVY